MAYGDYQTHDYLTAAKNSIEFAMLTPEDDRIDPVQGADWHCLNWLLQPMGLDPKQTYVQNDTVDFKMHHIDDSDSTSITDEHLPVYSIADNVFGICWTWNPRSSSTRGLMWHSNDEGRRQAYFILEGLSRFHLTHYHCLLRALLALQIENSEMRVWIQNQAAQIMAAQIQTGHHYYTNAPFYIEERGSSHSSQMVDLSMMSRKVCGLAINTTTSTLIMQRIVQLADFVLEETAECAETYQTRTSDSVEVAHSLDSDRFIVRRTRSAKRDAEGLLAEAEAWKHKATIMVQTMLSLITQQDQNISIGIAEDSRTLARKATRDSKSMKSIAAVTICFLPGTFVSALFAIPMFDWTVGSGGSVTRHLWIYWAVTLPLTVVVIAVWLAWTNKDLLRAVIKLKGN